MGLVQKLWGAPSIGSSGRGQLRAWLCIAAVTAAAGAGQARGAFSLAAEAVGCSGAAVRCSRRYRCLWCAETLAIAGSERYSLRPSLIKLITVDCSK